jgi:hypothetical protein
MAENGNVANYLTIQKLTAFASTALTIIIPLVTLVWHIENKFNFIEKELIQLDNKLEINNRTLSCIVKTLDQNVSPEICEVK